MIVLHEKQCMFEKQRMINNKKKSNMTVKKKQDEGQKYYWQRSLLTSEICYSKVKILCPEEF